MYKIKRWPSREMKEMDKKVEMEVGIIQWKKRKKDYRFLLRHRF